MNAPLSPVRAAARAIRACVLSPVALAGPCALLLAWQEIDAHRGVAAAPREMLWSELFADLVGPLLALQLVLLVVKGSRANALPNDPQNERALDRFVRTATVLSPRGVALLAVTSMLIVSPSVFDIDRDHDLEAMAIATVATLDVFVTLAIAISIVSSRTIAKSAQERTIAHPSRRFSPMAFLRRRAPGETSTNVTRELSPAVVDAGDAVFERFAVGGLSIPFGFRLRVEQDLPARLGGPTRLSLDGPARADATLQAPLPQTRRGLYKLPSPDIWYEDLLGFTRIAVEAGPPTELRVLPRVRNVTLLPKAPPRAGTQSAPLTKRPPTDDLFTVREYRPGDDARRVHWRHSVNMGVLHVRVPEMHPASPRRLRLVLDTFLPLTEDANDAELARLLDAMIEGWTSLARTLVKNGDRVTLTAAARDAATGAITVRDLDALPGTERQWRALGAELAWQDVATADDALAHTRPADRRRTELVVSAGFCPPSAASLVGGALILAKLPAVPAIEETPVEARSRLNRFLFSSFPVGAEDNALDAIFGGARTRSTGWTSASLAYAQALETARSQGVAVVSMQQAAGAVTFVTEAA